MHTYNIYIYIYIYIYYICIYFFHGQAILLALGTYPSKCTVLCAHALLPNTGVRVVVGWYRRGPAASLVYRAPHAHEIRPSRFVTSRSHEAKNRRFSKDIKQYNNLLFASAAGYQRDIVKERITHSHHHLPQPQQHHNRTAWPGHAHADPRVPRKQARRYIDHAAKIPQPSRRVSHRKKLLIARVDVWRHSRTMQRHLAALIRDYDKPLVIIRRSSHSFSSSARMVLTVVKRAWWVVHVPWVICRRNLLYTCARLEWYKRSPCRDTPKMTGIAAALGLQQLACPRAHLPVLYFLTMKWSLRWSGRAQNARITYNSSAAGAHSGIPTHTRRHPRRVHPGRSAAAIVTWRHGWSSASTRMQWRTWLWQQYSLMKLIQRQGWLWH